MKKLSTDAIRLITSSQVITSVVSVVKELVENSLDAGSSNVEIKLENYGFDRIEVRDNGDGIPTQDTPSMGRRHFTSKLSQPADLQSLATYGFRGEALGSLCAVSSVTVVTKTANDDFSRLYALDAEGSIVSSKPSHMGNGTAVTAAHLFKNLPVRKQYYANAKRRRDELKLVEDLIMCYGAVRPAVRFTLSHNKSILWQKNKASNHREALMNTWGSGVMSQMREVPPLDNDGVKVEGFLPGVSSNLSTLTRALPDRCWIAVNGRPVTFKEIEKMVKQSFVQALNQNHVAVRHLVMFLSITLPQQQVDVNLEPNKTRVLLENKDVVLSVLSDLLDIIYGQSRKEPVAIAESDHSNPSQVAVARKDNGITPSCRVEVESSPTSIAGPAEQQLDRLVSRTANQIADTPQNSTSAVSASATVDSVVPRSSETGVDATANSGDSRGECRNVNFNLLDDDELDFDLNFDLSSDRLKEAPNKPVGPNVATSVEASDWTVGVETTDLVQSVSATEWSKGQGFASRDGNPIEPTMLLIPGHANEVVCSANHNAPSELSDVAAKSPLTKPNQPANFRSSSGDLETAEDNRVEPANQNGTRERQRLSLERKSGRGIRYDLVNLKPVKRPQTSFEIFSKEVRPTIVEHNPGASFSEVSRILEEEWKQLDETGRDNYEQLSRKDTDRYNNQLKIAQKKLHPNSETPSRKKKKLTLPSNQGLIDKMLLSQQQRRSANQTEQQTTSSDIPTVDVTFTLVGLERILAKESSPVDPDCPPHLIGPLVSHGVWLRLHDNRVTAFNQYRVEEMLLYYRLMSNYALPRQPLDVAIGLSSGTVGGDECWRALLGLSKRSVPPDLAVYYDDERLTANGFDVRQTQDSETNEVKLQVIAMTTVISHYGIGDLCEILKPISSNQDATLAECRPLNVTNYFKGEAVRMMRNLSSTMGAADVYDIINRMQGQLPSDCTTCLHNKPFDFPLHTLPCDDE